MKKLRVALGERSYPIVIGRGILRRLPAHLKEAGLTAPHAVIVTQPEIAELHLTKLQSALQAGNISSSVFITPKSKSSEASKTQTVLSKLIKFLASLDGNNKNFFVLAFGGGVIGDVTGFASAIYRRGIPYVQIPTTLTAQVDSAIGGKTAVDLPQGKNLLGTIYQPKLVLAEADFLDTLPDRFWVDGSAEVIKYGMIRDPHLFQILEKYGKDAMRGSAKRSEQIIYRCAKIKSWCVEKDEFDKHQIRMILNFGHTAGHGIEAASRYSRSYTHGEAVAIGMLIACEIADALGVLKEKTLTMRLERLLIKFGLPIAYRNISPDAILKTMGFDKKADQGTNRFVLPVKLGRVEIVRGISDDIIRQALVRRKA